MDALKNPFAIRNGVTIFISDLTRSERGLNCDCFYPNCAGEFIARMGDKRTHHFAHSKDPCDDVIAYTTGLYMMIYQVLNNNRSLILPALVISYSLPYDKAVDENNITSYIRLEKEKYSGSNR